MNKTYSNYNSDIKTVARGTQGARLNYLCGSRAFSSIFNYALHQNKGQFCIEFFNFTSVFKCGER